VFVIFGKKKIDKKAAGKMLMKMKPLGFNRTKYGFGLLVKPDNDG